MTTMKSVILAAALGLASMTFASAKTYNLTLSSATKAGNTQLAAGDYRLSLEGHVATFTNVNTHKSVMLLVHTTPAAATSEHNAVDLKNENGAQRIETIELENSTLWLSF